MKSTLNRFLNLAVATFLSIACLSTSAVGQSAGLFDDVDSKDKSSGKAALPQDPFSDGAVPTTPNANDDPFGFTKTNRPVPNDVSTQAAQPFLQEPKRPRESTSKEIGASDSPFSVESPRAAKANNRPFAGDISPKTQRATTNQRTGHDSSGAASPHEGRKLSGFVNDAAQVYEFQVKSYIIATHKVADAFKGVTPIRQIGQPQNDIGSKVFVNVGSIVSQSHGDKLIENLTKGGASSTSSSVLRVTNGMRATASGTTSVQKIQGLNTMGISKLVIQLSPHVLKTGMTLDTQISASHWATVDDDSDPLEIPLAFQNRVNLRPNESFCMRRKLTMVGDNKDATFIVVIARHAPKFTGMAQVARPQHQEPQHQERQLQQLQSINQQLRALQAAQNELVERRSREARLTLRDTTTAAGGDTKAEPMRIISLRGADATLLQPGDLVDILSIVRTGGPNNIVKTLAESVTVHSVSRSTQSENSVALQVPKSQVESILVAESTGILRFILHKSTKRKNTHQTTIPGLSGQQTHLSIETPIRSLPLRNLDVRLRQKTDTRTAPGMQGALQSNEDRPAGKRQPTPQTTPGDIIDAPVSTPTRPRGVLYLRTKNDVSEVKQLLQEVRQLREAIQGLRNDVSSLKRTIQVAPQTSQQPPAPRRSEGTIRSKLPNTEYRLLETTPRARVVKPVNTPVIIIKGKESSAKLIEKQLRIIELGKRIREVDGFDSSILRINPVTPYRIMIQGLKQGSTTVTVTDESNESYTIDVSVAGDLRRLEAFIDDRFPMSSITIMKIGPQVVLRGTVARAEHIGPIVKFAEQLSPTVYNQLTSKKLFDFQPGKTERPLTPREQIEKRLNEPVSLHIEDLPLASAAQLLRDIAKINITLDKRGLEEEGLTDKTPISANVNGISLRSTLRLILNQLELSYIVDDETLRITSKSRAKGPLTIITYDLSSRLNDPQTISQFVKTVTKTLQPSTWSETGGAGSISHIVGTNRVVVRQTKDVHTELEALLKQLPLRFTKDRPKTVELDKIQFEFNAPVKDEPKTIRSKTQPKATGMEEVLPTNPVDSANTTLGAADVRVPALSTLPRLDLKRPARTNAPVRNAVLPEDSTFDGPEPEGVANEKTDEKSPTQNVTVKPLVNEPIADDSPGEDAE